MTILVLVGPAATEPIAIARRVAEARPLTVVIDVGEVVATLHAMVGADDDTKRALAVDLATAMATRLAAYDIDVVLVEVGRPGSTAAFRDGLMFVERMTLMALTAEPEVLAKRDLGRGPDMITGIRAWRTWRHNLAELNGVVKPSFVDYDVIIDCANRSRSDLVRLITAAL